MEQVRVDSLSVFQILTKVTGYVIATVSLIIGILSLKNPTSIPSGYGDEAHITLLNHLISDNKSALSSTIAGFAVFLLTEMITSLIEKKIEQKQKDAEKQNERNRQEKLYLHMKEIVGSSVSTKYVGPSTVANTLIREAIAKSNIVKNTFMNMSEISRTDPDIENEICSTYEMFLKGNANNKWTDIVSANEVHDFRHKKIFPNGIVKHGIHEIVLLRSSMPIVNFVILKNREIGYEEIFFGWINDGEEATSPVYSSTSAGVINMFERQFNAMRLGKRAAVWVQKYQMPADLRKPLNDLMIDKKGLWFTRMYDLSGKFKNNGFIYIDFKEGRAIISGVIGDKRNYRSINHINTTVDGSKIYFEYKEEYGHLESRGLCEYNFHIVNDRVGMKGYVYDQGDGAGKIYSVPITEHVDLDRFDPAKVSRLVIRCKSEIEKLFDISPSMSDRTI